MARTCGPDPTSRSDREHSSEAAKAPKDLRVIPSACATACSYSLENANNSLRRVCGSPLIYEGAQATDDPQLTPWRFSIYGGGSFGVILNCLVNAHRKLSQ